ncbi:MAG: DUF6293 family protein [Promethearchaeota archaeon]
MEDEKIFRRRIHITFNCEEDVAITSPIISSKPHKIYYFIAYIKKSGQKDVNMNFCKKNIETIRENLGNIEIETLEVDYTDHIEIIQELSKIVKKERTIQSNCEIFINALRCVTGIASFITSSLWNCELFYDYAEFYDNSGRGARQKGRLFFEYPFIFPFKKPSQRCIQVLKIIKDFLKTRPYNKFAESKYIKKRDLVKLLKTTGFLTPKKNPRTYRTQLSSLYSQLDRRFLNELSNLKYIKILDDNGRKNVFITKTGEEILKIYKYYL